MVIRLCQKFYKHGWEKHCQYFASRDDIRLCVTVDNPDDRWTGEIGVCTNLIPRADFKPEDTYTVVCGSPIMYKYVIQELEKKEFKSEKWNVESVNVIIVI